MPIISIPAAAEGVSTKPERPMPGLPGEGEARAGRSFRRFLNRCRAAVTAFKHAGDQPRYLVVYERTGFEDDCGGNPSFSSRGHTAEGAAALFVDTTLRWTREAGGDCERARVVMVVGEIDLSGCQDCAPGVFADA